MGTRLYLLSLVFQPLLLPQRQRCLDERGAVRLYVGSLAANQRAALEVYVELQVMNLPVSRQPMAGGPVSR